MSSTMIEPDGTGPAVRELGRLPKAHLHVHLEGAMRPSTLADLAEARGVATPPVRGYRTFDEFGTQYRDASSMVETAHELRRVVREVVEDGANDGAVWVEPHFYPPRYAGALGTREEVTELVLDEAQATAERLGIGCGIMIAALRDFDPAEAVELAELAARYADDGVVSFGLAADEALHPPEPFADAFSIAREAGLISAPHAGELAGPPSVYGALDALGASRICHGVRAVEDPALVERLAVDGVVLDVCPTSNVMLGVAPSYQDHPLAKLLEAGVRCSLNGDDPLLFGVGVLGEYEIARRELGMSDAQLAAIARASIQGSGAPDGLVATATAAVGEWLAAPLAGPSTR